MGEKEDALQIEIQKLLEQEERSRLVSRNEDPAQDKAEDIRQRDLERKMNSQRHRREGNPNEYKQPPRR